ncbi:MAG: TIM barrel protein [Verrucomicrobia bacterium]|nr:TIM barrel protein [Verrucomicrobiota bacterium]
MQPYRSSRSTTPRVNRRGLIKSGAALAAAMALGGPTGARARAAEVGAPGVRRGRIKHSIVHWCFETAGEKWTVEQTCQVAKELGCLSVELVAAEHYPTLQRHGLKCAIGQIDMNPDPPFVYGFNNPAHGPRVMKATREAIDAAAAFGVPSVICFTGYSAKDPARPNGAHWSKEQGAKNCVQGFKQIVGYAEQKGVTLCLEMLNTREDTHPMKGHPGYQGDHTDYCIDIVKRVGSPRLKLLFDVYHVQIMDGDVIRRIRQHKDYLGHVHTAGNPGRGELDDRQEINYPPIMRALVEVGYGGYVGHEFIPTRDPRQGLREAVAWCDV